MPSTRTAPWRRLVAIGAAVGVATVGLSVQPASAARAIEDACPAGEVPEDGFTDTGADATAVESAVDCIVAYDIARGTSPTTFSPLRATTRAQMATFVMAGLDVVDGYRRPAAAPDAFSDDEGDRHEANIDDAAAEGIVGGFADGTFRPGAPVSRGQMATFLVRALDAAGADLPTGAPDAFDDDDGTSHEENIDIVASLDIADGTSARRYEPAQPVLRQQMALFLARSLDLLVEEDLVTPLTTIDAAPASADAAPGRVVVLDEGANELALDDGQTTAGDYEAAAADLLYRYDSNDTFRIAGTATDLAGFEAALSRGDAVDPGAYDPEPSGTSVFDIVDDAPKAPISVSAEKGTGAASDDITVTIDPSTPATVAMYQAFVVQRAPVPNGPDESPLGVPGTFQEVGRVTVPATATGPTIAFVDRDVPAGAYRYRAAGVIDGDTGATTADPANETSTTPPATQTGPASTNAVQLAPTSGFSGTADSGDVWRLAFDRPVTLGSGATIALVEGGDADRSGAEEATTVARGAEATMALNGSAVTIAGVPYGAGRVLTVTLVRDLAPGATVTGGNGTVGYPLTVASSTGIADASGEWDVASSFDRTIESDVVAPRSTGATVGDDGNSTVSDGDTIDILFDGDLRAEPARPFADSIRISDGAQAVTLTHGANATFAYTAPVDDPTSSSNLLRISGITTGTTGVDYSGVTTVVAVANITDPAGNGWDGSGGGTGGATVLGDTIRPSITSATASTNPLLPLVVTLTYSEAIRCIDFAEFQWSYDDDVTTPGITPQPTSARCPGGATTGTSSTIQLEFEQLAPATGRSDDAVAYTEAPPTAPGGRVVDPAGNRAVSPQTRPVN